MFVEGIITIGDLLSDAAIFLKGVKVLKAILSPMEHFGFMSIVVAIPLAGMDTVYLNLADSEVILSKVSAKLLYKAFQSRKQVPRTAKKMFQEKLPHFCFIGR